MAGAGTSGLISAGISQASGLAGALSQIGAYKRAEKSTKRLTEWNYLNSPTMMKQGMKNAGLSTAGFAGDNAQGTEVSQPQPRDMSGAFSNLQQGFGNMSNQFLQIAEAHKVEAEAKNQEIKNSFETERQESEVGVLSTQLNLFKETFNEQVDNWRLNNQKMLSEISKNSQEVRNLEQTLQNLRAVCEGITIDNKYKAENWQSSIRKLNAETNKIIVDTGLAPLLARSQMSLQSAQSGYYNELSHLTHQQTIGQHLSNEYQKIQNASARIAYDIYERTGIDGTQGLWQNVFGLAGRFGLEFTESLANSFSSFPLIHNMIQNICTSFNRSFKTYPGFRQFHTKD